MTDHAVLAVEGESRLHQVRIIERRHRDTAGVKGDGAPLKELQHGSDWLGVRMHCGDVIAA
jgi:hypothetical protein